MSAAGPQALHPSRARFIALYVGGLLGPFGGGIVNAMLPELAHTFGATKSQVGASLTVYFVPFAALLLVSGTLGERWGRERTVRAAYIAYAAASLGCAVAPSLGLFLAGRAAQGMANAFTTPLLLAGLAELAPPGRTGRAIGVYVSFQAAGQSLSPLVGGLAAEVNWRLAFVGVAMAGALLAFAPPPGGPRGVEAGRPPIRPLLTARMALLAVAAFTGAVGLVGISFLVSLRAREMLGMGPSGAGLVLICFGLAGLALGRVWGQLTDRLGNRRCGVAAALAGSLLVMTLSRTHSVAQLALIWTVTGVAGSLLSVTTQGFATGAAPENRGGAVSATLAFRFGGAAAAPALWLPLYHGHPSGVFMAAGAVTALTAVALAPLGWLVPGAVPDWGAPTRPADRH